MPTYEYVCNACNHAFEVFQRITENPVKKCPDCGKLKAQRIISSGGAIIFKGSGFYQTDYRSEEYKSKAKKETESASPAPEKKTTGPEPSKPEKKTAEKK